MLPNLLEEYIQKAASILDITAIPLRDLGGGGPGPRRILMEVIKVQGEPSGGKVTFF